MSSNLYTVIVNWNLRDDTLACVDSLLAASAQPGQIIIVDNGSTDGSIEAIRNRYGPTVYLLEAGENLGFAGGNNLGIRFALEKGADWVFLLNNDTLVATDSLVQLEKAASSNQKYTIYSPIIYYYDKPEIIWHLGDHLIPGTLITFDRYRDKPHLSTFPEFIPVDFVNGCGMMIQRDVFNKIGLFDSSLFMYGEEVDFCWRARLAGFRFACATKSKIWHKVAASANQNPEHTRYLRVRNQIQFYRKYARGLQIPLMFVFSLSRSIGMGFRDYLHMQSHLVNPLMRGWFDGWFRFYQTAEN